MNRKLKKVASIIVLCIAAWSTHPAMAITRYASPTGGDSNGTSPDRPGPFSTMAKKLQAGDTLYLADGQYNFKNVIQLTNNGSAGKYITIAAAEGAKPILDFRETPNKTNALEVRGSYYHIKGITLRYSGYKGIWLEKAKYCILENLEVYGCCDSGIQLRSGGYNLVINCDSHDNFDYQSNGGNADGFADKQGNSCPGNVYIGCRAWNNSDDGWDSYQRVTSDDKPTVYIHCMTYNNGQATFDLSQHPRANGVDKNLSCFSGKDLANFSNGGNPNGFKLGGKQTVHHTELYRCLAIGHRGKGFDQNNNSGTMTIVNCTSYNNQTNYGFGNSTPYSLYLYNSISLTPTSGTHLRTGGSGETIVQSYNSWNSGFSVSDKDFKSLDVDGLLLAPRNPDGSLSETLLLRLEDHASALIDKGRDYEGLIFKGDSIGNYLSYMGEKPDLGCYETMPQASAIAPITLDTQTSYDPNAPMFDLSGHRVDAAYKGVVVQYGKVFYKGQ